MNSYGMFIGAKIIGAKFANLEDYKKEKWGEEAKINEGDSSIYGYIVIYPPIEDGEEPYKSWSPKKVFETCYRRIEMSEINLLLGDI